MDLFWEDNPNVQVEKVDEIEENFEEGFEKNKAINTRGVIFIKSNSQQIKEDKVFFFFKIFFFYFCQ